MWEKKKAPGYLISRTVPSLGEWGKGGLMWVWHVLICKSLQCLHFSALAEGLANSCTAPPSLVGLKAAGTEGRGKALSLKVGREAGGGLKPNSQKWRHYSASLLRVFLFIMRPPWSGRPFPSDPPLQLLPPFSTGKFYWPFWSLRFPPKGCRDTEFVNA